MIKESKENKDNKKAFIEHSIGTRKYFSYRADLMFFKFILCTAVFLSIYMMSQNITFSFIIALETFLIFTLVNKLKLERKAKEGKEIYYKESKKEYFNKKLNNMTIDKFELLIKYFFEKQGYINYKKIGNHLFTAEKDQEICCIKTFKLYEGIEIEKIDIRSFIVFMSQNNYNKSFFVTCNEISEEAVKLIKKTNESKNENMSISIMNNEKLIEMAEKYNLIPDESYFYNKINSEKPKIDSKKTMKSNAFDKKKILIYLMSAILFYAISVVLPGNMTSVYISWYFVILSVVCVIYLMAAKITEKSE